MKSFQCLFQTAIVRSALKLCYKMLFLLAVTRFFLLSATAEIYIVTSTSNNFPFTRGIVDLNIQNGTVKGAIRPQTYYPQQQFVFSGTNGSDGELDLRFSTPKALSIRLTKSIGNDGSIAWSGHGLSFFRINNFPFSDAALAFTPYDCAGVNSEMQIVLNEHVQAKTIKDFFSKNPSFRKELEESEQQCKGATCKDFELALLSTVMKKEFSAIIKVPIGTELYFSEVMRPLWWVKTFDLLEGGCGGGYTSNMNLPKAKIFSSQKYDISEMVKFIDREMDAIFPVPDNIVVRKIEIPLNHSKFGIRYKMEVYANSKITRQVNNYYDHFVVVFSPFENEYARKDYLSIEIDVQNLMSTKKAGTTEPPQDISFYKLSQTDEATFVVSERILKLISERNHGWCDKDQEGNEHDVKCQPDNSVSIIMNGGQVQ